MVSANPGTYLPDPLDHRIFGLDISSYQGDVDFIKLANPEGFPDASFVACRTGISWAYKDSWFETYWKKLEPANPIRLAYHVLYPSQPIKDQVDNMKSRFAGGVFDGDGVVNDLELHQNVGPAKLSEAAYEFTNRLRDWSKKPTIVYSRYTFIESYMDYWSSKYSTWMHQQDWWMAWYYGNNLLGIPILKEYPTSAMKTIEPLEDLPLLIHQTGAKGDGWKVGTVSRQVDTNRWTRGDVVDFYKYFNVAETPPDLDPTDSEKLSLLWEAHPELH